MIRYLTVAQWRVLKEAANFYQEELRNLLSGVAPGSAARDTTTLEAAMETCSQLAPEPMIRNLTAAEHRVLMRAVDYYSEELHRQADTVLAGNSTRDANTLERAADKVRQLAPESKL